MTCVMRNIGVVWGVGVGLAVVLGTGGCQERRSSPHAEGSGYGVGRPDPAAIIGEQPIRAGTEHLPVARTTPMTGDAGTEREVYVPRVGAEARMRSDAGVGGRGTGEAAANGSRDGGTR